jgi:hypothetical protein
MANKTTANDGDVDAFLAGIADDQRRQDAIALTELMRAVTGQPAVLWGTAIVGFGTHHYRYETGREGDIPAISFSPRKAQTTLYPVGLLDDYADQLSRLGPHTVSKGCLYIKRIDQVDPVALREIVAQSYRTATAA